MELSTTNYRKQRDFHILLASSVLILGMYAFQDLFSSAFLPSTNPIEILQLDQESIINEPIPNQLNLVEFTGVVAYNQLNNLYILQTTNGSEYVLTSRFADFLELVGESVKVGGNLTENTIEVDKIEVQ